MSPYDPMRRGTVYFIGCDKPEPMIKVGWTGRDDVNIRLKELSACSPVPLELYGSIPGRPIDELTIHVALEGWHSHFEWFAVKMEDVVDLLRETDERLAGLVEQALPGLV